MATFVSYCLVLTFSGCYRFEAELTSSGYKTRAENTLSDCNQLCKTNGCDIFQWNRKKNECRLFRQAILKENKIFSKEVNSMIGIPDCNDDKVFWLQRPFEVPTTATTTTTIITQTPTTSPTAETDKPRNEEKEPSKYIFLQIQTQD